MDRVFLDANVLFSAAYRRDTPLRRLWRLTGTELITSAYALEEARVNLRTAEQRDRLERLAHPLSVAPEPAQPLELPPGVDLPAKDRPILLAAINSEASALLTGDVAHFGRLYGRRVEGVLILPPSRYLAGRV